MQNQITGAPATSMSIDWSNENFFSVDIRNLIHPSCVRSVCSNKTVLHKKYFIH
jgi:hypothetical protein